MSLVCFVVKAFDFLRSAFGRIVLPLSSLIRGGQHGSHPQESSGNSIGRHEIGGNGERLCFDLRGRRPIDLAVQIRRSVRVGGSRAK